MSKHKVTENKLFSSGKPEYVQIKHGQTGMTLTVDLGIDQVCADQRLEEISTLKFSDANVFLLEVDGPDHLPWPQWNKLFLSLLLGNKVQYVAVPEKQLEKTRGKVYNFVMEELLSKTELNPVRILGNDVSLRHVVNTAPLTARILPLSSCVDPELKAVAATLTSFQEKRLVPQSLRRLICSLDRVVRKNTRADKKRKRVVGKLRPNAGLSPVMKDDSSSSNEESVGMAPEDQLEKDSSSSPEPAEIADDNFQPADDAKSDAETVAPSEAPSAGPSKYDTLEEIPGSRKCYACHNRYPIVEPTTEPLKQYPRMCPPCADLNWRMRDARTDFKGYYAIVTGGRVKIGYETVLKLLRDGCYVITTTRFPHDASKRYSAEDDYTEWSHRLQIYPLELKDYKGIYKFVEHLKRTIPHLDILINNAAQTLHRPYSFHEHLMPYEQLPREALPPEQRAVLTSCPSLTYTDMEHTLVGFMPKTEKLAHTDAMPTAKRKRPLPLSSDETSSKKAKVEGTLPDAAIIISKETNEDFPAGCVDEFGQQLDLRQTNSWRSVLEEVPIAELVEVMMVNTIAPYILNKELKGLMVASTHQRRFIVNVSAMEGQFNRVSKTRYHPHTNMAKAALNMMTRTGALGYYDDHIYMTSVDTGWVTDERPFAQAANEADKGFILPLDCVDGAARIVHPVYAGVSENKEPYYAVFLKNYSPYPW